VLQDNPAVRAAVAEALTDQRPLLPVFIFDPRFLDRALGSIWTHRVFIWMFMVDLATFAEQNKLKHQNDHHF